jgi:hypothetical protein
MQMVIGKSIFLIMGQGYENVQFAGHKTVLRNHTSSAFIKSVETNLLRHLGQFSSSEKTNSACFQ